MVRPILECRPKDIRPTYEPTQKEAHNWAPISKGVPFQNCIVLRQQRLGAENCPQPISEQV